MLKAPSYSKTWITTLSSCLLYFSSLAYAAGPCSSLTQTVPVDGGNNTYLQLAYQNTPITINITLSDYASFITKALAGQALTTSPAASIPFCAASTKVSGSWDPNDYTSTVPVYFGFYGPAVTFGPPNNTGTWDFKLTSTSDSNDILAANAAICDCNIVCSGIGDKTLNFVVNSNTVTVLNQPGQNTIPGFCSDVTTPGHILIDVYAPPGVIPAVGNYTTGSTPFMFGLGSMN